MALEAREYLIVRHLQSALQQITVASGYHYDVAAIAVKLDPNHAVETLLAPAGPRPFVLIEVKPDRWDYFPSMQVRIVMPITLHWVSEAQPLDDESRMQLYFRGCADVERAIMADISRGGNATDTRVLTRVLDTTNEGTQAWARIDTEIRVNRRYGSPDV